MLGFDQVSRFVRKHLTPPCCRLSCFIVFERLETSWNPKHKFLKLLLQQRKLLHIITWICFLNEILFLVRGMSTSHLHLLLSDFWYNNNYFICICISTCYLLVALRVLSKHVALEDGRIPIQTTKNHWRWGKVCDNCHSKV